MDISAYSDFFPDALLEDLSLAFLAQSTRKVIYKGRNHRNFPEPFRSAATFALGNTAITAINTAIAKWYRVGEPSAAFDYHYDPPEYDRYSVLCSIGGVSKLVVRGLPIDQLVVPCQSNTVVVMPADYEHKIQPPDPTGRDRQFLFLGHESR